MNHRNSNYKLNRYQNNNSNTSSQYSVYRQDNQNRGGAERGSNSQYQGGNSNNSGGSSNQYGSNPYQGGSNSGSSNYQSGGNAQTNQYSSSGDNQPPHYQNSGSERRGGGDNRRGGGSGYQNKERYSSNYQSSQGGHGSSSNHHGGSSSYQNNSYNQGGYSGGSSSHHSSRGSGNYHNNNNNNNNTNNSSSNNNNSNSNDGGSRRQHSTMSNTTNSNPNNHSSNYRGGSYNDRNYERRRQDRTENRSHNYGSGHHSGSGHNHHSNTRNNGGHHHGHHHNNNYNSQSHQVQNFYNNNKNYNHHERKNLETFHIRVFHNWVKSVLIQKYGEITRSIVKAQYPQSTLPENYLYILDLACGKGGDHKKWLMHSHAAFYIGVDIALDCLKQAYDRAVITLNEIKYNTRHHSNIKFGFFEKDCTFQSEDFWRHMICPTNPNYSNEDGDQKAIEYKSDRMNGDNDKKQDYQDTPNKEGGNDETGRGDKELNSKYMFDIVSCQMAMHYMHETEQSARNFLDNCSERLNDQGFILLTFTDGESVLDIVRNKGQPTEDGGAIYTSKHFAIKFDTPIEQINIYAQPYGNKYGFYLQEAVGSNVDGSIKFIPEYLVNANNFIELAKEYCLEVRENSTLPEFYENNKTQFGDLLKQMKVSYSSDEDQKDPSAWEVSHCYRAVVLQKVLPQPSRIQFDRSTRDKFLLKYPVPLDYKPKKRNED